MIAAASRRRSEERSKRLLSVQHWIDDLPYAQALERLASQPTVNIEGLVAGYTGPGGKTVLPGLIDMHVHLFKGDDLHLFIAAGVTTVRDVGGFTDQMVSLADKTRSGEILGPRIFFSGESFIHESGFAQWQRPTKDPDEARLEVKKRIASGAGVGAADVSHVLKEFESVTRQMSSFTKAAKFVNRMAGYDNAGPRMSSQEKQALKKRRKLERMNRKRNRR